MAGFVTVAKVSELGPGEARLVTAGTRKLALFNIAGTFYAIDNACKHRGGPLCEGELEGSTVICPWHGWEYDVRTGHCESGGAHVNSYPIQLQGDEIQVAVE